MTGKTVTRVLVVCMLVLTMVVPAFAEEFNNEKYDLTLTNYVETIKETLILEEGMEEEEYDVYVVTKGAKLTLVPKITLTTGVLGVNLGSYMDPQVWTIDGSQALQNYVDADSTAVCELDYYDYYNFFAMDSSSDFNIDIIIKVVDESTVEETTNTEPVPVEFDPNDAPASWAKGDVEVAIQKNLIPVALQNNYKENITRAEFCQAVVQLIEAKTGKTIDQVLTDVGRRSDETTPFTDASEKYILNAYQLKIINGRGNGIFDPNGNISRQDAAVMLTNVARVLSADLTGQGTEFNDKGNISSYAATSVKYVSAKGIMGGVGNSNFSPKTTYTRQQSYITLLRLFNTLE